MIGLRIVIKIGGDLVKGEFPPDLLSDIKSFAGSNQVVLVHGDTHFFKLDKPLIDQAHLLPNFTRLETFGSPNVHWVKATANPRSRNYFTFEPMVVAANHP